jgi:glycosyltransferase involved in cell wall biosynthesis
MLKLYINGRFLSQKMTGQQRFSLELVVALDRWLADNPRTRAACRPVILAPRDAVAFADLRHVELRKVGTLRGHLWDQVDLPRYSLDGILLSLCGTGPLVHPRHVVTIHDAAPFANPENFTKKFRLAYSVLVPLLAKAARRIITVSHFSKREIARYCRVPARKIEVVPNGADHILSTAADPSVLSAHNLQPRRYVFALGSMSVNKNFRAVVEAFNRLNRGDLALAVAGGENAGVFAQCEMKSTANLVRLGYVSDAALRALYENALCFVLPSLYEGFGIPPVEAMLCGCPVIVSTAPALVETCGEGALFCDPHSPAELAEKIVALADDGDLGSRMRARGLARARRFTWDDAARRIIGLLQRSGEGQRIAAVQRTA